MAIRHNDYFNQQIMAEAILRLAEDSRFEVSPLRVNIDTARFNEQINAMEPVMEHEGGHTRTAIEATIPHGFCLESEMPSNYYTWTRIGDVLHQFSSLNEQALNRAPEVDAMTMAQAFCHENRYNMTVFPGTLVSDIALAIERMDIPGFFQQLVNRQCQNRITFNEVPTSMSVSSSE